MAAELDAGIDFVPGTSRLFESSAHAATSHLKRDGEIVLSPQPSDSPNDPLNWSLPRKYLHAILLVFVTGLTAATANDAGSAQDGMHAEYGITYETMNIGGGVLFVGIGYWTFLISPAASFVGEASVQLSLSEIFFEHQVGSVIGIYVLATNVGNYLGPVIAAYVAEHLGWRWIAWLAVIICACTLVVLYFGLEETMQYLWRLWHTLRIFGLPAVIYSGIQWGAQNAWLTFYTTVEQSNWYGPPRNYSVIATGLMNVPCIIGVVVGCFWGGFLSDRFVLWMAKRRNGIREAEDRLWMMAPCLVCSPGGMLLFGMGSVDGWDWPVPYVGLGLIGFGWGCAGDLSMSYLMDAYPGIVLEGMVGVAVINNSIGYIFAFTASKWLLYSGVRNCFIVLSVLDFFFIALTLPMILYGKACRRWTLKRYRDFVNIRDAN
ncbi:major facilitator superfamily transporter [Diplocarpon rosae]|nr:major facilitator superfamily transporter [Diplocarpon rosae]